MQNFVEELVAEHYRTQGYLVMTNYWIPYSFQRNRKQGGKEQNYMAQSWTDIDILARNDKELLIIQVKAIINQMKVVEKIKEFFELVDNFIEKGVASDGVSDIKWWKKVPVKKIVVYEWENSPASYINEIEKDKNTKVIPFREYYDKLTNYVKGKKGVKEENAVLRLLHFIKEQDLRDERKIKKLERQRKKATQSK
jgi:hypothetical protein